MTDNEKLIDRIDGLIDSLDEHVMHEDMANALASLRELVQAGCLHDWQNRVSGGSRCRSCNVWQDKRVVDNAHVPTADEREALAKQITALHLGVIRDDALAGDIADAGRASATLLRRSEVPESQGEPSDAQVIREAAQRLLADVNPKHRPAPTSLMAEDVRIVATAALRAAGGVR